MNMDNHGGMISTAENSWVFHDSSLALLQTESSIGTGEGSYDSDLTKCISSSYFWRTSNMPQNLTTWGWRLYFPYALRRAADLHRPWPGLNQRNVGPIASMLTISPPRTAKRTRGDTSLNACFHSKTLWGTAEDLTYSVSWILLPWRLEYVPLQ
jgi:hypothetical protein